MNAWAIFIITVYIYYGDVKLGTPDSEPEYNDLTWFTMLFSCGVDSGVDIVPHPHLPSCTPRTLVPLTRDTWQG